MHWPLMNDSPCLGQIQGNFLIRRTQVEAAMQIISPQSGNNTVMQVNMGEGKSSVIIPMAAVALADGKQLVRVIVPKPLTVQMFEVLVALLGGLVNRPVYHLPFSRLPGDDNPQINDLHKLMSQCMAERGILLVQPEHVVSLKLMSVEEQIRASILVADSSSKFQRSVYKRMITAVSLTSVSMGILSVVADSSHRSTPACGRQPCGQHVSMAAPVVQSLEQKGCC